MPIRHVVAATDHAELAQDVLTAALGVCELAGARLTVLTAVRTGDQCREALLRLSRWEASVPARQRSAVPITPAVRVGLPGIEICRYAEEQGGDLIVVGRHHRSQVERLLMGDTADAVSRRSRVPCLCLPPGGRAPHAVHAALDGTLRGGTVYRVALGFAEALQARLTAVTVEERPDEVVALDQVIYSARTETLLRELRGLSGGPKKSMVAECPVDVRYGPIVDALLASVKESGADTLAVGVHRGGPPGVMEAGSIGRRLLHLAPCTMLTIPL